VSDIHLLIKVNGAIAVVRKAIKTFVVEGWNDSTIKF
jgi:hypothetical protein